MTESIRIVVADDHPLFRDGVINSFNEQNGLSVVGQAETGEEAFEVCREYLPDVLLLDIAMPGEGGISAAQKISVACPATHIAMLTVSEDHDDLMQALKAGARGYVLKGISANKLADIVRRVAAGEVYISPSMANDLLFEMTTDDNEDPFSSLTEREKEVLTLLGEGLSNREIGERLHLSEKTIKHYMTNVLGKLHVKSRLEAALLAQKHGLKPD